MSRWIVIAVFLLLNQSISAQEKPAILTVVSSDFPRRFVPSGALADSDRQAHDLIYEPLVAVLPGFDGTPRPHAVLAERVPVGNVVTLRPNAAWSNGEPVTAGDARDSLARLSNDPHAVFAYGKYLDPIQIGRSPSEARLTFRHGLLDPWPLVAFPISVRDKAGNPLGSGPFVVGELKDGVAFRANPRHPLAAKLPFQEIHWYAAANAKEVEKRKPDVVLGPLAESVKGSKSQLTRRVWYVAVNHRHPLLGQRDVRRFLALSIDRDKIAGENLSVNGLTPRDSWTQAPAKDVKDLYQPEIARGLAKTLGKNPKLTFKYPADQESKMAALIDQWQSAAKAAGQELTITAMPLAPAALADALANGDYELALASEDHGDHPARLEMLFKQIPGFDDSSLWQIVALLNTRQFPKLQESMHRLHVHLYQTMPVVPLWRHQASYALTGWRVEPLDALRPFVDLTAWRK